MSTQRLPLIPKGTWYQVTNVSKAGLVRLISGSAGLTEQPVLPTDPFADVPRTDALSANGDTYLYFNIEATDFLFAYAIEDLVLDVTPEGGVL